MMPLHIYICIYRRRKWQPYNGMLLAIRKNEILPFATIWVNLEGIMLSKISHRERQLLYDLIIWGI